MNAVLVNEVESRKLDNTTPGAQPCLYYFRPITIHTFITSIITKVCAQLLLEDWVFDTSPLLLRLV